MSVRKTMRSSVPCSSWIDSLSLLDIQVVSRKKDYSISLGCQVEWGGPVAFFCGVPPVNWRAIFNDPCRIVHISCLPGRLSLRNLVGIGQEKRRDLRPRLGKLPYISRLAN